MEINPYQGTLHGQAPEPKSWHLGPTLLGCLAVIGILGVLVVLFLPMRRSREGARRMQCANNLKQIGVALHSYHDKYGALPPAFSVDAEGKPLHSWRTLILPFLEYEPVYKTIDLSKPWDDPANKRAFDIEIPPYVCPSADLPQSHTAYMAITVPGGCFRQTEPRKFSEITDGHAQTVMVMEVDEKQAVHWMSPTDSIDFNTLKLETGARLQHSHGFQVVFVDGSVHFLSTSLKPETHRALVTIDGKEVVGDY